MTTFTILPFEGADPIMFSMTPDDVARHLGPAQTVRDNFLKERDEHRAVVQIAYSSEDGKVADIGFVPGAQVFFNHQSLFHQSDLPAFLMRFDPAPKEKVGFLIFPQMGIAITGFHDGDTFQRAITVFRRGRFDDFLKDAVLYHAKVTESP